MRLRYDNEPAMRQLAEKIATFRHSCTTILEPHVVHTPHGTVIGRTVRRQKRNLRVRPDIVGKLKSLVQYPALSQAELLRVLPASVPIRLSGETDIDQLAEEQGRAAHNEQMEGIVDERVRAEITRPL